MVYLERFGVYIVYTWLEAVMAVPAFLENGWWTHAVCVGLGGLGPNLGRETLGQT